MIRFILQRLAETALVLLVMSFVIYGLISLMPGDPIDLMIASDPSLTPEDAARLKAVYGLDRPLHERYLAWLGAALQGDFGYSRLYARPVLEVLWPRLGNTVLLMGASFTLALLLALPAGILAAARPHGLGDNLINLVAFAGISIPTFWLAILLIILFAVVLGVLPAGGTATVGIAPGSLAALADRATYLVLPVLTLTLVSAGTLIRYIRAAMIEALRQDHIRTARAKGVGPIRLLLHHALRNAMIPVVTILALDFGTLFSGALVAETIFAYLGMGKTIYDAVMGNDYNLALVGLLLATAVVLLANLLADLAYAWLDPRISYR
ncbi:ABC transporter permease [Rhodospirillaceae bacterium SYSU D60014]|uniref:ABC transporter permease n=1 Tax=Virgifigura deserti TaxID=2268457 RepID=UPI000E669864